MGSNQYDIREATPSDIERIASINATAETETSPLARDELATMIQQSYRTLIVGEGLGFVIAFDQSSGDDGQNFAWFCERYQHFVYIDRIIIAPEGRGKGIAKLLYDRLAFDAREDGYPMIACEVNVEPPNPHSLHFHNIYGFSPIQDWQVSSSKTVRYLKLDLTT